MCANSSTYKNFFNLKPKKRKEQIKKEDSSQIHHKNTCHKEKEFFLGLYCTWAQGRHNQLCWWQGYISGDKKEYIYL